MAKMGFIGLGNMGLPMARDLVKAGRQVTGFDLSKPALAAVEADGGRQISSAVGSVAAAEAVVTALPAARHVRSVYQGEEGVLAAAPPGMVFIDTSAAATAPSAR